MEKLMLDLLARGMIWTSTYGLMILLTIGAIITLPNVISMVWLCWVAYLSYELITKE